MLRLNFGKHFLLRPVAVQVTSHLITEVRYENDRGFGRYEEGFQHSNIFSGENILQSTLFDKPVLSTPRLESNITLA